MRPVSLTTTIPAAYPQAQLEAAPINVFIPTETRTTVTAAEAAQAALIDQWDANGRTTVNKSKQIYPNDATQNATANQQFNGYAKALANVDDYQEARGSLIGYIGQYCSYCELPLTSSLAVEHTLPKYWFPQNQLTWTNFLLACPICNSAKGNNPNQQVCDPAYTNSTTAANQIAGLYAWPNTYWQSYSAGSPLPVTLQMSASEELPLGEPARKRQRLVTATPPPMPPDGMTLLDIGFGIIIGSRYLETTTGGQTPSQPAMTPVTVGIRGYGLDQNVAAFNQTIELANLNKATTTRNEESASDLRVAYRSLAYARTQSMLMHFHALICPQGPSSAVDNLAYSLLKLIVASAAASGFWTVWVYALRGISVTDPSGVTVSAQSMLRSAFTGTADTTWTVGG